MTPNQQSTVVRQTENVVSYIANATAASGGGQVGQSRPAIEVNAISRTPYSKTKLGLFVQGGPNLKHLIDAAKLLDEGAPN